VFREDSGECKWHYQWIVVHDYLKRYVVAEPGYVDQLIAQATQRKPFSGFIPYSWKENPFLPVEFSAAAFRWRFYSLENTGYLFHPTMCRQNTWLCKPARGCAYGQGTIASLPVRGGNTSTTVEFELIKKRVLSRDWK
jgi:hypothetical protein